MICFKAIIPAIATDPSLVAGKDERDPRKPPIGVRATPTMQTSVTTLVYKKHSYPPHDESEREECATSGTDGICCMSHPKSTKRHRIKAFNPVKS